MNTKNLVVFIDNVQTVLFSLFPNFFVGLKRGFLLAKVVSGSVVQ